MGRSEGTTVPTTRMSCLVTCTQPCHWVKCGRKTGSAAPMICALHNSSEEPPGWARSLGCVPIPVPDALHQYVDNVLQHGAAVGSAELCMDRIITPAECVSHIISGSQERALVPRDPAVAEHLHAMFHHIESQSETKLAPWDLYLGHSFIYVPPGGGEYGVHAELAILFRAKEFPLEYRKTKYGDTHPVGSPLMGGERDPRIGTCVSVNDHSFPLRNLIWLLSTNTVYELNVRAPGFPEAAIADQEFCTVNASALGTLNNLFDVNYFPWLPSDSPEVPQLLLCPPEGCPVALRIGDELAKNQSQNAADIVWQHVKPLDRKDLDSLQPLVCSERPETGIHEALQRRIPPAARPMVLEAVLKRSSELEEKCRLHNIEEHHKLARECGGVDDKDAELMLQRTKSHDGNFSAFRAANLLQVLRPHHRSAEQRRRFGEAPPEDEDVACQVWRVAFYADSALEALEKLDQDRSLTPQEAAEAVVAAKEEQTRAAIAAQQQAAQAARQAAREVSAL